MKNFKKYLKEMAIAGYGDWVPSKEMIGTKSAFVVKNKWNFIDEIIDRMNIKYVLFQSPNKDEYILGNFIETSTENIFEVVFSIKLNKRKDIKHSFKYKKEVYNVDGVQVHSSKQGNGIALSVYTYLDKKLNMYILGDEIQYFGARKLWSRLSKRIDIIVDIIDIESNNIIEENVVVHHGDIDDDYDGRVWGEFYSNNKKHIRLILKDIKSS